jgi:transketolase
MNEEKEIQENELVNFAFKCRNNILDLSTNGGCFTGSAFSCIDILSYIYLRFFDYKKIKNCDEDRDLFILSKGHAVSALYAILAELDFFPKSKLSNYLSIDDDLYWHPNTNIHGIEFHTGSMGHGLSIGIGMAMASSKSGFLNKTVVLLGDGELNEGSIWESILIGNAYNLKNLFVIIDRNSRQANMKTENLIPLDSLEEKFSSFGWDTYVCNGHDFFEIDNLFCNLHSRKSEKPVMIIANTIRGKGISLLEDDPNQWFGNFSLDEIKKLKNRLLSESDLEKQCD